MRKLTACAALAMMTIGGIGTANAGEVTGKGKKTAAPDHARSICAYSGLEDGLTAVFDEKGNLVDVYVVEGGPGFVQTPHMENSYGIIHSPGVAGQACRGYGR
jgi:hypothetical protein